VTGGLVLGIRLRFHNHAPQQLASGLAFHQQAADELGGNQLGGAAEEGLGQVLGGRGGYGSGLGGISSPAADNLSSIKKLSICRILSFSKITISSSKYSYFIALGCPPVSTDIHSDWIVCQPK
jgi:hypothetical protein